MGHKNSDLAMGSVEPKQKQSDVERFMSFVEIDQKTDAWLWNGGITGRGYGAFWYQGKTISAHRFSYEMKYGPVPNGLFVCHKHEELGRHNVNPDHLFLGTGHDNMRDASLKGRMPFGTTNKSSKITPEIAQAIALSTELGKVLSDRFGVSQAIVSKIRRGTLWSHATGVAPAQIHSLRNKSGFRGVSRSPQSPSRWRAGISFTDDQGNKGALGLGEFDCPIQAARAYDEAASHYHKSKAKLNFPVTRTP